MKKIFFLLVFISLYDFTLLACDICGCGVGSYYMGIMPQFNRNFVGIRYRHSSFDSHIGHGTQDGLFSSTETFHTAEAWARYYPAKKIQLLAFIPLQYNQQKSAEGTKTLQGLGDILVMGSYNLFKTPLDTIKRIFKHNLFVGGGVKLPTGNYVYQNTTSIVANPNFQLGTGSTDFLLNLTYTIRHKQMGLNTDITYKINTTNGNNYQFGNRISSNVAWFYIVQKKKWTFMPNVGCYTEYAAKDTEKQQRISETGGHWMAATTGLETYYGRYVMGINGQIPFAQNLASGNINGNVRLVAHFSFLF